MSERREYQPITRHPSRPIQSSLLGTETLKSARERTGNPELFDSFSPNGAYRAYMEMPKLFANRETGRDLIMLSEKLSNEWMPDYLDAGGWASAEAALVCDDLPTYERMRLLNEAQTMWERAIANQGALIESREKPWLIEHVKEYRMALNLAFTPLMKSIVAGDVTEQTREKVFADTLAIAQSGKDLAQLFRSRGMFGTAGSYIGFGHECNALLAFLYVNDPKNVPLPSTYRAGTGYEHRTQTHDITVIGQKWGNIHRIFPVEIKAKPRSEHKRRYKALIIKGRTHMTLPGERLPYATTDAFAACYEGDPSEKQIEIVRHTTSTVRDLLDLYRKGACPEEFRNLPTKTSFHEKDHVVQKYAELGIGNIAS